MNSNVIKNMRRITVLCEERSIPYNYAPTVDTQYLVLWPGLQDQYVISATTCFSEIPGEVFAEIPPPNDRPVLTEDLIEARDLGAQNMVMVYFEFEDLEHHQGRWECFNLDGAADCHNSEYEEILYRVHGARPLTVHHVYRPSALHAKYVAFLKNEETHPYEVYEG